MIHVYPRLPNSTYIMYRNILHIYVYIVDMLSKILLFLTHLNCWVIFWENKCCGNNSTQVVSSFFGRIPCNKSRKLSQKQVNTSGFLVDSPWFLNHIQGPEWEQTTHWEGFVDPLKWTFLRLSTLFRNVFFPSFVMSKWFECRKILGRTISCTCRSKVSQTEPTTRDFSTENPSWGTQIGPWRAWEMTHDPWY